MSGTDSLALFSKAAQMLAEANTIQKAKELKSLALTAADYAKRKGMGEEAIKYARSYALDAERKMGEMLAATKRNAGARGIGKRTSVIDGVDSTPKLSELGVTPDESSRIGLGELPTPGLIGWIELAGDWKLSTHKTKVEDLHETLSSHINLAFQDIITEAAQRGQSIELNKCVEDIQKDLDLIFERTKKGRAKRNANEQQQSAEKKPANKTERKQRNASEVAGQGNHAARQHGSMIKFGFDHFGSDGPSHKFQGNMLMLNRALPQIRDNANNKDVIRFLVFSLVAHHIAAKPEPGQLNLKPSNDIEQDSGKILSELLRSFSDTKASDGEIARTA